MRVVHLNTSDFGGAAMAAINLHRALLKKGVRSDLLTLNRTRNDVPHHAQVDPFALAGVGSEIRYKARRVLERMGIVEDRSNQPDNRYLRNRPPGKEIFSLPYSFFPIHEDPLVQQADVVHLHWVSYGMLDYAEFFANHRGRVVWTLHDMNPFTGGCHHADDCSGYERQCESCPQLRDRAKVRDYWRYKQNALKELPLDRLRLAAPSHWLAAKAEASSIMRGRSCAVIPNGFDRNHFKLMDKVEVRDRLGLPEEKRIVLFNAFDTGNHRKGMDVLLSALEGHGTEMLLVCLGHAPDILAGRPDVRAVGFREDPREIARYYAAADVFVLPSLAENLPNTICESLLCGTPVVAFDLGGIPEQIDATNGILVGTREAVSLRAAIDKALSSAWDHGKIAADAAAKYDQAQIADRYLELYSS